MVSELDITGGDERKVGYYAGLIVSATWKTLGLCAELTVGLR